MRGNTLILWSHNRLSQLSCLFGQTSEVALISIARGITILFCKPDETAPGVQTIFFLFLITFLFDASAVNC